MVVLNLSNSQQFDEDSTGFPHIILSKRAGDIPGSDPKPQPAGAAANSGSGSGVPKIGGSSAAFIALVVGLAAIFLLSTIAIFFLLRSHRPDAYERHARRVLAGKRESSIYETPFGPQGMRAKFKNLFGFGRKKEGWVRANSGDMDEWDPSVDFRPGHGQARELTDRDVQLVTSPTTGHAYNPPPLSHKQLERNATSDSVELTVPDHPPPNVDTSPSIPQSSYSDPFVSSPTSVQSRESHETVRDARPERFSVQSGSHSGDRVRSMRKLESGTKFVEGLDF